MTYSGPAAPVEEITVEKQGAQLVNAALSLRQLHELENVLAAQPTDHAGLRLFGIPRFDRFSVQMGR